MLKLSAAETRSRPSAQPAQPSCSQSLLSALCFLPLHPRSRPAPSGLFLEFCCDRPGELGLDRITSLFFFLRGSSDLSLFPFIHSFEHSLRRGLSWGCLGRVFVLAVVAGTRTPNNLIIRTTVYLSPYYSLLFVYFHATYPSYS